MKTITFPAIGTTAQLTLADERYAPEAEALMRTRLEEIDHAASRFRPDSELMLVQSMGGGARRISVLLAGAVHAALAAAKETDGLVDPTIDPSGSGRVSARWDSVELDPHRRVLEMPAETALDLGATGKALTADRIAREVSRVTGSPLFVSLGGDIAVAGRQSWDIGIADDHAAERADQVVQIRSGGVATSSTIVRPGHIVDPRTGQPVESPWRTVTVAARSCLAANTASTAAIVLGEHAPAWLAERGLAARLVAHDGTVTRTGGWPA